MKTGSPDAGLGHGGVHGATDGGELGRVAAVLAGGQHGADPVGALVREAEGLVVVDGQQQVGVGRQHELGQLAGVVPAYRADDNDAVRLVSRITRSAEKRSFQPASSVPWGSL